MTVIYFEIRNLIMLVSAIHDDEWLEPFSLMPKICFYLMLYDVINYNVVISAAVSYESVKDVRFTDV